GAFGQPQGAGAENMSAESAARRHAGDFLQALDLSRLEAARVVRHGSRVPSRSEECTPKTQFFGSRLAQNASMIRVTRGSTRREFFVAGALSAGALALSVRCGRKPRRAADEFRPGVWIRIAKNGSVALT